MKHIIPKDNRLNPKIEIRSANVYGKGLFAKESIKVDEIVLIWGGKNNYTNNINVEKEKKAWKLVIQWDEDLFSYEERWSENEYYINHSCNSNLWMKDTFTLIAKRPIKKDEEITADYSIWECDKNYVSKWECKCGEKYCRKKITGNDYKLSEVQKRYKDHFSPFINKKIATKK